MHRWGKVISKEKWKGKEKKLDLIKTFSPKIFAKENWKFFTHNAICMH
jgi:hypothetical protein